MMRFCVVVITFAEMHLYAKTAPQYTYTKRNVGTLEAFQKILKVRLLLLKIGHRVSLGFIRRPINNVFHF